VKGTELSGDFETHLTIASNDVADLKRLQQWAELNNMKCLHIVLDRGETASQPMVTRRGKGELSAELERAKKLSESLKSEGFQVTRIKIEATGLNQGAAEIEARIGHRYFEHHIKLLLDPSSDIESLSRLVEPHSAHLSRNALKKGSDGRQERYVTQRCLAVDKKEAGRRLKALLSALSSFNLSILKVEEELVIYDSNLELDNGWIVT
jgi:hypothetical protein